MRIVVAMSGGVDSSVAALELKEQGHDVVGVTIKTWPKEECGAEGEKLCCSLAAIQFARSVAEDLDIPYYVVDLSREFADEVKTYFAEEYARGRTPNPCVYCNSKIKFGHLLKKTRELGAENIATGHYARIIHDRDSCYLAESVDLGRDQSYFLYDIPKETLPYVEFPLGEYSKEKVREIAIKNNLMSARRKASQDICFATAKGGYREYLTKIGVTAFVPGDILDVSGKVVGQHDGIASYTVGQRRGVGVAMGEPVYVLEINVEKNTITIGHKPHAMKKKIRVGGLNFLMVDKFDKPLELFTRIRHRGEKSPAIITPTENNEAIVEFKEPQFAPTPGQAAVFYKNELVAGGGWIEEVLC